ncbi:Endoplasmin [Geodia barretti]|nr:Endoplasmin [Geodia barretti]
MEINPRHPLIKELQRRVSEEEVDSTTSDLAQVLYETALLRSGYVLKDSSDFAGRIERMMRLSLGVDLTAPVEEEEFFEEEEEEEEEEEIGDEEEEEEGMEEGVEEEGGEAEEDTVPPPLEVSFEKSCDSFNPFPTVTGRRRGE